MSGAGGEGGELATAGRSRPQYLQRIASSWIASAQNGHFFNAAPLMGSLQSRPRECPAQPLQST